MLTHVRDGLPQPGVGLHFAFFDLLPEPDLEVRHDGPASLLVAGQPGLWLHPLPLGLGIGPIDLPELQQQMLDLSGELVLHLHEPAAGVGQAMGQDGVQRPGFAHHVCCEGITHLNGGREVLGPVLQNGFQVLAGVVMAGDEQSDPVLPNPGKDGAGVNRLASFSGDRRLVQDPHDRVVVV